MQTSVNLQDPFSYSIFFLIVVVLLFLIITIYFIMQKRKKTVVDIPIIREASFKDLKNIKHKYLKKLDKLGSKIDANKISIRIAYQSLSIIIRFFVYEVTNIKVQNYTLRDIKRLNMPVLYELIQEYYTPEFAMHSLGDTKSSLEKTRKVIEKWN